MLNFTTDPVHEDFLDELSGGTKLLLGQYKIDRYINAGGFGITYLAKDSLDRQIVVKECFPRSLCHRADGVVKARSRVHVNELDSVVKLFVREARALSKLEHPNIVGVHQVFEESGTAYMALDFVEGSDLLEYTERTDLRLSPKDIQAVLEKLLDAVGFVHSAGLLHRDISPDNIILTKDLEPILIDFGAAREQATKATQALSALRVVKDGYSPQEFYLAGSEQGPESDLYSLAATFYHVITSSAPPDSQLRITAHVSDQPDPYIPLAQKAVGYDANFCAALDKAMAILPKDRVQTAAEWKALLEAPPAPEKTKRNPKAVSRRLSRIKSQTLRTQPIKTAPKKTKLQPAVLVTGLAAIVVVAGGLYYAPQIPVAVPSSEQPVAVLETSVPAQGVITQVVAPAEVAAPATTSTQIDMALAALQRVAPEMVPASDWVDVSLRVDLPFTLEPDATVASVDEGVLSITRGVRILTVNDTSVESNDAVLAATRDFDFADGLVTRIEVSWIDQLGMTHAGNEVIANVIYDTKLNDGPTFETRLVDNAWQTTIVEVPDAYDFDLRVGDQIIAFLPGNERIDGGASLASIITRELEAGKSELNFAIRRDTLMWVESITVADTVN